MTLHHCSIASVCFSWTGAASALFATGGEQLENDSAWCTVQGFAFQAFAIFLIWAWMLLMVVMYQIIVKKHTICQLRTSAYKYWGVTIFAVAVSSILPLLFGAYGKIPGVQLCWLNDKWWRLVLLGANLIYAMLVFLRFMPPILYHLFHAFKTFNDVWLAHELYFEVALSIYWFALTRR